MSELFAFLLSVLVLFVILALFYWLFMLVANKSGFPWAPTAVQVFFGVVLLIILITWWSNGMPMQGWKGR